jgi:alkanesulfonate monooxygenase SsuD/methylene tetrahydromethanopterin reductase-like flavin-dependent oxidoreductase (luciferase family)
MKMARDEKLTMRQVMRRMSSSYGHRQVVGTADDIADDLERWFVEEAADGFNILAPDIPADFTEHVVPRLQARGLFRTDYVDGTLRDNLGLPFTDARGGRTPADMP